MLINLIIFFNLI